MGHYDDDGYFENAERLPTMREYPNESLPREVPGSFRFWFTMESSGFNYILQLIIVAGVLVFAMKGGQAIAGESSLFWLLFIAFPAIVVWYFRARVNVAREKEACLRNGPRRHGVALHMPEENELIGIVGWYDLQGAPQSMYHMIEEPTLDPDDMTILIDESIEDGFMVLECYKTVVRFDEQGRLNVAPEGYAIISLITWILMVAASIVLLVLPFLS